MRKKKVTPNLEFEADNEIGLSIDGDYYETKSAHNARVWDLAEKEYLPRLKKLREEIALKYNPKFIPEVDIREID